MQVQDTDYLQIASNCKKYFYDQTEKKIGLPRKQFS